MWVSISIAGASRQKLATLKQDISNTLCLVIVERKDDQMKGVLVLEVMEDLSGEEQQALREVVREIVESFGFDVATSRYLDYLKPDIKPRAKSRLSI